jgi:transposase
MLLALLIYGYAAGVFSSRKIERATFDSVAFRFIAANDHPDHDTIATFRRRFLKDIERLFVEVLMLAREMGMLKLGTVALDGTKIHANASLNHRQTLTPTKVFHANFNRQSDRLLGAQVEKIRIQRCVSI